jgi:hypothetical protein
MITRRTVSLSLLGTLAASRLFAQEGNVGTPRSPGVIELFTSQGCSSCPPADALMLELAAAPDIIPLTFPVEVWDYLGWKDTLAKPAFTARQKAYAAMVADRRVFTPQAVVNGKASCVGSDPAAIGKLRNKGVNGAGGRLIIEGRPDGWQITAQLPVYVIPHLFVLPIASRREVRIGRGENSGRTITYANVVRDIRDAGPLEHTKPLLVPRAMVEAPEADAFALLAQLGSPEAPGPIIAAAFIEAGGIKA